ncbi:biotin transporter BioY [Henriciella sp.]|uniref:biotin transporter BioY n=1 Tax=Henriciella sp. TaxID=1968823 RepID=UPI0026030D24|nr:biotin transporter BioY [Henriciella sp.]
MKQTISMHEPRTLLRPAALFLGGIAVLTASSWVAVPMVPVPVTMQTLAVLLVGALAGPRFGFAMIVFWLGLAALGAPVLSEGKAGIAAFVGPTAGYLLAFPVVGYLAGLGVKTVMTGHVSRFAGFLALHGLILLTGWAWLATIIGAREAFAAGVAPFLIGALIKSGLGAAIMAAFDRVK